MKKKIMFFWVIYQPYQYMIISFHGILGYVFFKSMNNHPMTFIVLLKCVVMILWFFEFHNLTKLSLFQKMQTPSKFVLRIKPSSSQGKPEISSWGDLLIWGKNYKISSFWEYFHFRRTQSNSDEWFVFQVELHTPVTTVLPNSAENFSQNLFQIGIMNAGQKHLI